MRDADPVLIDSSVWVDHLRQRNSSLSNLLADGRVLGHPMVAGELACGNLSARARFLSLYAALPAATLETHAEAMKLLERHRLHGRGLGYVDLRLLTSCLLSGCRLWTLDRTLASIAGTLGIEYRLRP